MTSLMSETSVMIAFSCLPDPRSDRNRLYTLGDIVTTAILGTLCRCEDYGEISDWADANLDWLQSMELCVEGAPSHDTYERFFHHLDSGQFQSCFVKWTQHIQSILGGTIAIDGKTLRGSGSSDVAPLHMVSAFAAEAGLVLGQLKAKGKGGELETIQRLLEILDVKGATITIDAAGCHKVVAKQIKAQGGDYVLSLKGNQGKLHDEVRNFFNQAHQVSPLEAGCDFWCLEEKARGREEKREVWATDQIGWLPQQGDWAGLRSIACVKRTTQSKGKTTEEVRFFISSLNGDAEALARAIRQHWAVENQLHWHLDVTYREDQSRVRKGNGAENLSVLRRATMNILRNDKTSKRSLRKRRFQASLRREYLLELMGVK